ncbi:MAG: hypothetical protein HDT37_07585 [Clostridiales bacterium]|nr:hypothetical protein [Clostridiales bacterium]
MRIAVSVLAILFGLLHIIAAVTQFKSKDPARGFAIVMFCGGICVTFEAVAHLIGSNPGWMDALACATGCMLICFSAYANGRRSGNLHLSHHIVRGTIAALLVAGFVIW